MENIHHTSHTDVWKKLNSVGTLIRTRRVLAHLLAITGITGGLLLLPPMSWAQCTNCTTTIVGSDIVHTFNTGNGTFTPPTGITQVQYLVVGGGAGGGGVFDGSNLGGAGGGGAGGYQAATGFAVTPLTVYATTVGAGGTAGVGNASQGGTGGNSIFSTITANGGGGGASAGVNNDGVNGASGGGARITGNTGGNGTVGQGNNGGNGNNAAGGGGGSSAAGANGGATIGGAGGTGTVNNITGVNVTYAAGGSGGNYDGTRAAGAAGAANTGNGGGGASGNNGDAAFNGGAGGSGVVIIRYTPQLEYFSRSSGTWTGNDRWSLVGCGGASAGAAEPGIGNRATICNGDTVTLDTSIGGIGLLSLTVNAGGELQMANDNTARTLTVAGDITNDGTLIIPAIRNTTSSLIIGGNLTNDGIFDMFTDADSLVNVTFNGSAAQVITGTSANSNFHNLTLNNANGLELTGTHNAIVNTALTLTSGLFTTNANYVYVANGSAVAGAGANTFVAGNLRKQFTTGVNVDRVFEVGSVAGGVLYAPVVVRLGNVTGAGDFTVSTTAGDHPAIATSTLEPSLSINRYWSLANNSVAFAADAATGAWFIFNDPQDYDTGADFNQFYVGRYNGASWTEITPAVRAANGTIIVGAGFTMATFPGDYQVAQRVIPTFTCPSGETFISGLLGSYYDYTGQTFPAPPPPTGPATGTRVDGPVDFNWAGGAPGVAGIGADQFAVRWDGALNVTTSGTYQFQTVSDDGVRLWINDILVIDNWTDHAPFTNTSGNVPLMAGITYSVRLEFYENGGGAEIRLRWGPSGGPFTAIPAGPLPLGEGLYYCASTEPNASILANYRMDEASWNGTAGEIEDSSGNGNHASRTSGDLNTASTTPARGGDPGTCGYGVITDNGGTDAVNTGLVPGTTGSVTFWYRSNTNWNAEDQMLLDAGANLGNNNADKHFYLIKRNNGDLQFRLEDSADTASEADTANFGFTAGEWVHIGITWSLTGDLLQIYVNGALADDSTTNLNGTAGAWNTLYIGDSRTVGVMGDDGGEYIEDAINGQIDEVRIYSGELTPTEIIIDWLATHPCTSGPDHIRILHDGEGLTCAPEQVLVRACMDINCNNEYTGDVTTTLVPTGWVGGDTISFNGGSTTAELRITTAGSVTLDAGGTVPLAANNTRCFNGITETCTLNFVDSGFIFDVPNLTACRTSADITVTAVKTTDTGDTCAPAFSGARTVGFWSGYANPTTGTQVVSVSGTPVGTTSPGTGINLNFDANAQAVFNITYPDAGMMQLNARYEGSGTEAGLVMTGNDQFVSVPVGLAVNATTDCPAGDASCPVFGIAGNAFPLTVRAACWVADGDTDLSDNPVTPNFLMSGIPMTHNLIAPGGGDPGTLGTGSFDFAAGDNGISTFNQTVSEVGVFTFTATPAANAYFGQTIPAATSPFIGRFRPSHFALSAGMISDRVNMSCTPASTFTYMEEGQRLELTLTAQNAGSATTANYRGAFAMLDLNTPANLNIGAIDTTAPTPLSSRINTINSSGSWVNGVANPVFATISLDRDTAMANNGPFTSLSWGIAPVDTDGVQMSSYNLDVNDDTTDDHTLVAVNELRFGRAFVESTSGSELLPLTLPVHIEHYNGTQFVRNTNDSCSIYNSVSLTFANRVSLPTDPIATGNGTFISGTFDPANPIQLNSGGNSGSVDATLIMPPYLQFDWDNDLNFNDDPTGKATFGIFDINSRQIYTREVY